MCGLLEISLVDVSDIFVSFSARGGGRGSPRRQEGGGRNSIENPRMGGGVFQEGEGPGGCLERIGEFGGGGLNIFFRGRNSEQN